MSEYYFFQDVKVITWERRKVAIEANTEEEAISLIKKYGGKDVYELQDEGKPFGVYDCEILHESSEAITVAENDGFSTIEWYSKCPYRIVYNNGEIDKLNNSQA